MGAGVAGLTAGCSAEPTGDGDATDTSDGSTDSTGTADGTVTGTASGTPVLRVGTYPSFVGAPSSSRARGSKSSSRPSTTPN
ncbi:hypothetical protein ACFQL4_11950 [Halosimplex aquaticum]